MFVPKSLIVIATVALYSDLALAAADPAPEGYRTVSIGVTRTGRPMTATIPAGDSYNAKRPRVLIVYGLNGDDGAPIRIGEKFKNFEAAWVLDNPDAVGTKKTGTNFSGGNPALGYPPKAGYYDSPTDPESRYLWRWIGMYAPDLVVNVEFGKGQSWRVAGGSLPQLDQLLRQLPEARKLPIYDGLPQVLVHAPPCDVGLVPAVQLATDNLASLHALDEALGKLMLAPSPARLEIQNRLARSPQLIAEQLLESYGKQLPAVQYIPALALVGRLRHERNARGDKVAVSPVVLKAAMPYLDGKKPALDAKANGSTFSGHLIFAELAEHPSIAERDRRLCVELIKAVGDRAFDKSGKPLEVMPSHNEMSDAVFMNGPILAYAGKLTGDAKYFEASVRNMKFMQKLCLRDDGIYRHSPLDEAAWGRGNGFPALGLAWTLDALPESFAGRSEVATALEKHLRALLPHQDHTGMWHQVIDKPESYAEFTATAMIAYAMARGVREGRLDAKTFDPPIRRAWEGLKSRIAADGTLVDVCTGTGKQPSLRAYYDRPAILGRDDRGGAMALMIVTEMELYMTSGK
ncbi:MAG: glycoside hydrolase family 88 protein [Planctomycetes bacterium]|nr:glycoside hydrolase family 88 protein [Planctomycetota bacterium]